MLFKIEGTMREQAHDGAFSRARDKADPDES
jgi:hypothetical protein